MLSGRVTIEVSAKDGDFEFLLPESSSKFTLGLPRGSSNSSTSCSGFPPVSLLAVNGSALLLLVLGSLDSAVDLRGGRFSLLEISFEGVVVLGCISLLTHEKRPGLLLLEGSPAENTVSNLLYAMGQGVRRYLRIPLKFSFDMIWVIVGVELAQNTGRRNKIFTDFCKYAVFRFACIQAKLCVVSNTKFWGTKLRHHQIVDA